MEDSDRVYKKIDKNHYFTQTNILVDPRGNPIGNTNDKRLKRGLFMRVLFDREPKKPQMKILMLTMQKKLLPLP